MNQRQRILNFLRQHKAITSLDGLRLSPPVIRVSNRCNELIQAGIPIKKERIQKDNTHYTKYTLNEV